MAQYTLKVYSYNAEAKKEATKTFSNLPSSADGDTQTQKAFALKYAALTDAATTTAEFIKATDVDLS